MNQLRSLSFVKNTSNRVNGVSLNHVELLQSSKRHHKFRNFCTFPDLAAKNVCLVLGGYTTHEGRVGNELIVKVLVGIWSMKKVNLS
ncbi:tRNA N6-adenosine threonylcarbamoyltransferase [Bienertia sinuspersici]